MKKKIMEEMESYFGRDQKRINHAYQVLGWAEEILKTEQGDREIVEAAAEVSAGADFNKHEENIRAAADGCPVTVIEIVD